jgi:hypothetical protein
MKIRRGFVSNSSSSSFVLATKTVQFDVVEKVCEAATENDWKCSRVEEGFEFSTWMDNFDLIQFAIDNGVPEENILAVDSENR